MSIPKWPGLLAFGQHIDGVRRREGLTQTEVATEMAARGFKWVQTTVTKTENGSRPLQLTEYMALCDILEIDPVQTIKLVQGPEEDWEANRRSLRLQIAEDRRKAKDHQAAASRHARSAERLTKRLAEWDAPEAPE